MRKLHITNATGRDSTVAFLSMLPEPGPKLGLPGDTVALQRYLGTSEEGLHEALVERLGEQDYGQALVDGDPEVDMELVGRRIGETSTVLLSSRGEVLHAAPKIVEVRRGPDGEEKERRAPQDEEANVNDEAPVRWTGRKIPRKKVASMFVFTRTMQVRHVDGLTFDYLHTMAKELDDADVVVYMGGGNKGKEPLIFQTNGMPYRGFLEGRVDGPRYQLLLHLSNMELKRPAPKEAS